MFYLTTHSTHFISGYMASDHSDSDMAFIGRLLNWTTKYIYQTERIQSLVKWFLVQLWYTDCWYTPRVSTPANSGFFVYVNDIAVDLICITIFLADDTGLAERKEGNILFNDAFNTLYLRLYGVDHMVKDHSDSERGNPLPPRELLFPNNSKGSFICTILQTG